MDTSVPPRPSLVVSAWLLPGSTELQNASHAAESTSCYQAINALCTAIALALLVTTPNTAVWTPRPNVVRNNPWLHHRNPGNSTP